jgi:hypothetical protein
MAFITLPDDDLTGAQMRAIIAFLGLQHKVLAPMFGCSIAHVNSIVHDRPKKTHKHCMKRASDIIKDEYRKALL